MGQVNEIRGFSQEVVEWWVVFEWRLAWEAGSCLGAVG